MSSAVEILPARHRETQALGCLHCGDVCGVGSRHTTQGDFCCAGCEAVYALLATHGLDQYYACEIAPGKPQRGAADRPREDYAALDEPGAAARFVTRIDETHVRATFSVPAMHCSSCLWLLERLWRFGEGIGRSEADVLTRTVRVEFNPGVTTVRAVAERLASIGYPPVLDAEQRRDAAPGTRRSLYLKIGLAGFAFGNVMLFSVPRYLNGGPLDPEFTKLFGALNLVFATPVLLYSASDYLVGAWRAIRARTMALEVPIAIGLLVLFGRSAVEILFNLGEGFLDSFAGLVFFLLIGRLFQQRTFERIEFDRSARSFLPLSVLVEEPAGASRKPIDALEPGDTIVLRAGEVIPADGTLLESPARVDYAFVTGEQIPVTVTAGMSVQAGGRITGAAARLRVDQRVSHSRLAQLWANPVFGARRAPWLTTVLSRFGFWFTVSALGLAAAGAIAWWPNARMSVQVATAVLIIACPCAFTLAAPIALGTATGVLGRIGLFLRQPAVVLDLSRIDTVIFDKTGTLTTGGGDEAEGPDFSAADWSFIRTLAAQSSHPVSRSIARGRSHDAWVHDIREVTGAGLAGVIDGHRVVLGSAAFVSAEAGHAIPAPPDATWASVDGQPPARIHFNAPERHGAAAAALTLARQHELWLLSGDDAAMAFRWEAIFGTRMRFGQTAGDKLEMVRTLQAAGRRVLMIGDGLNDAGALAVADAGLAVTDDTACLVPACDGIISGVRLADLPAILAYARRARAVIATCFAVSIAYNAIGLALALGGHLTPLVTAILMPVSSLTIVALAAGLMRITPAWRPPA